MPSILWSLSKSFRLFSIIGLHFLLHGMSDVMWLSSPQCGTALDGARLKPKYYGYSVCLMVLFKERIVRFFVCLVWTNLFNHEFPPSCIMSRFNKVPSKSNIGPSGYKGCSSILF